MRSLAQVRVLRQGVAAPLPSVADAVRRLLAVQAQDLGQASWAVAQRSTGAAGALAQALADRSVVRLWPMRGTLHLVAAEDARWLRTLLAPRAMRALVGRRAALGLDDDTVAQARRALQRHLEHAVAATRDELQQALAAAGVSPEGQRGYHLLSTLAQEGLLLQGGLRDREPTFSLTDAHFPAEAPVPEDEALARLAARYVDGHGPVTADDLAWWSGLPLTVARRALLAAGAARDGDVFWPVERSATVGGAHLLAGFDELLLGYRDRSAHLDPAHAGLVCPGGNGVFRPTVWVDGRMVGTWSWKARARDGTLAFTWFGRPPAEDLGPAVAAWERYQGRPARRVG